MNQLSPILDVRWRGVYLFYKHCDMLMRRRFNAGRPKLLGEGQSTVLTDKSIDFDDELRR